MKTRIYTLILLLLVFGLSFTFANNLRIYDASDPSNTSKVGVPQLLSSTDDASIPNNFYAIQFNLMWDNSWKLSNPRNWDAAWVFVKYNLGGMGWNHVYLADTGGANPKHGVASSGFAKGAISGQKPAAFTDIAYTIAPGYSEIPGVGKKPVGIFIHRAKNGYGSIQFEKLRLMWNFQEQGLEKDDPVTISVFAIEMVYVPDGEFYLGTGGTEINSFCASYPFGIADAPGPPYVIRNEEENFLIARPTTAAAEALLTSQDSNYLARTNVVSANPLTAARVRIPKEFPKGTKAYYMMKYEVTQEAYVFYLNTLNIQQQAARTIGTHPNYTEQLNVSMLGNTPSTYNRNTYRNGIILFALSGAGTYACNLNNAGKTIEDVNQPDDGQNIPMGHLYTSDLLSYLAWAGLRPATEFEFEKASRGTQLPVKNEYAWGNTTAYTANRPTATAGLRRPGYDNETPQPPAGETYRPNCLRGAGGPIRVGSFADSASSRIEAGASYWGIMELSGNLNERYVTAEVESSTLVFKGIHGYGTLDPINALYPLDLSWPAVNNDGVSARSNYIFRGGGTSESTVIGAESINTTMVSNRFYSRWTGNYETRSSPSHGGRGVRTAVADK